MTKLKLSNNSLQILEKRYLKKDKEGSITEKPEDMFKRVANNIALADAKYLLSEEIEELQKKQNKEYYDIVKTKDFERLLERNKKVKNHIDKVEKEFYNLMIKSDFLPNSPTLFNAGRRLQQLAACFVLPVEDDLDSIFKSLHYAARISKSGSGTGFNFSHLRPKNEMIRSVTGFSSGPLSFMKIFDAVTEQIKLGGLRRGAHMGILRVDHPDIEDFITIKSEEKVLENFNISVAITDKFMKSLKRKKEYDIINPRTNKKGKEDSERILNLISEIAWKTGDPGVLFIDKINDENPTPEVGNLEATDSCGEQPLLPYEAANLGSVNLSNVVEKGKIDFHKLEKIVIKAIHFLDNVIDMCKYPNPETNKIVKKNRKIGLGVMGFADMLVKLEIPYNSEKAIKVTDKIMRFIRKEADKASVELAKERGVFENWEDSIYNKESKHFKGNQLRLRNATRLTLAPTGSVSIIAGVSFGIEPLFALSFVRVLHDETEILNVNKNFEDIMKKNKLYREELMKYIAKKGSIQKIASIPQKIRDVFVVSYDIEPEYHVKIQSAFQKHVDNAVSKTVTLPKEATVEDVKNTYLMAYELGCKGISIYRFGSRDDQVLLLRGLKENQLNLTNWLRRMR
ncbi:ribonucleoside-diphosphate reductase, adenosylcobalamin-dependent [Candidatus Woesearchaeota archaeon]|nr:ribonucleoside-diphosphate reductase, adenosylcobalamin-dependent [Candidatus Woesearchaeota archaeon]|tara:strand:- start:6655 stop:8529 length:1875 start_codon:yes stop_codon:yes gene_type:complete